MWWSPVCGHWKSIKLQNLRSHAWADNLSCSYTKRYASVTFWENDVVQTFCNGFKVQDSHLFITVHSPVEATGQPWDMAGQGESRDRREQLCPSHLPALIPRGYVAPLHPTADLIHQLSKASTLLLPAWSCRFQEAKMQKWNSQLWPQYKLLPCSLCYELHLLK